MVVDITSWIVYPIGACGYVFRRGTSAKVWSKETDFEFRLASGLVFPSAQTLRGIKS